MWAAAGGGATSNGRHPCMCLKFDPPLIEHMLHNEAQILWGSTFFWKNTLHWRRHRLGVPPQYETKINVKQLPYHINKTIIIDHKKNTGKVMLENTHLPDLHSNKLSKCLSPTPSKYVITQ